MSKKPKRVATGRGVDAVSLALGAANKISPETLHIGVSWKECETAHDQAVETLAVLKNSINHLTPELVKHIPDSTTFVADVNLLTKDVVTLNNMIMTTRERHADKVDPVPIDQVFVIPDIIQEYMDVHTLATSALMPTLTEILSQAHVAENRLRVIALEQQLGVDNTAVEEKVEQ